MKSMSLLIVFHVKHNHPAFGEARRMDVSLKTPILSLRSLDRDMSPTENEEGLAHEIGNFYLSWHFLPGGIGFRRPEVYIFRLRSGLKLAYFLLRESPVCYLAGARH